MICKVMCDLWSKERRRIEDFLPVVEPPKPKRRQTDEEMYLNLRAISDMKARQGK